jgi:glycosyltransferase involved in cell wall biosynthesis
MISIGLPAVKPQFLADAISSALNQTFTDFELIIVNDRADETIRRIVQTFDDVRIRYFEVGPILPVVENWNRVLSYAMGDLFVLFSDDDLYHPEFLSEMKMLLDRYPMSHIAHCRVRKINSEGEVLAFTNMCPEFESGLDFIFHRMLGDREQFAPEFVVRTQKLKDSGGFTDLPLAWGSDDLTWFKLAVDGGIAYSSSAFFDWRQSRFQISQGGDAGERLNAVDEYSVKLRGFTDTLVASTNDESETLTRIRLLFSSYMNRQKEHLVAVNARNTTLAGQLSFFFRHRKKHRLKVRWLLYSCYSKYFLFFWGVCFLSSL